MASSSFCNCNNTCNRTSKRGACPCRSVGRFCTEICSCGRSLPCTNREAPIDLDLPVSNFEEPWTDNGPAREEPEEVNLPPPQPQSTQKRKRVETAATETQPVSVRRKIISNSTSEVNATLHTPSRKKVVRKTSTPRASKPVKPASNPATKHRQEVESFAAGLEETSLRKIVVELLSRDPGAFQDYSLGYMPQDPPESPPPDSESPPWCRCGNCRTMDTPTENTCCMIRGSTCCATEAAHFYLIIDPAVLDLAMAHYNDFMVHEQVRDNNAYRHQAYRQFVLQRFGKLGAGNRTVVPSCVVLAIRNRFPDPEGRYTGFLEA